MENEHIIAGNKIIAEFMGAVLHQGWTNSVYKEPTDTFVYEVGPTAHSCLNWLPNQLEYHERWDWLMPVVEKIEEGYEEVHIMGDHCRCIGNGYDQTIGGKTKIKAVWNSIVQFIIHFNTPFPPIPEDLPF